MPSASLYATTADSITIEAVADSAATNYSIRWYYGIGTYTFRDMLNCDGTHTTYTSHTAGLPGGTYQVAVEFYISGVLHDTINPPNVTITGAVAAISGFAFGVINPDETTASWSINAATTSIVSTISGTGTNHNLTTTSVEYINLVPNNNYTVSITPKNSAGNAGTVFNTSFSTPPASSTTVTFSSITRTSFSYHAQSNYYGANSFNVYLNGVLKASNVTGTNNGSGYYYINGSFTGLSSGTAYAVFVTVAISGIGKESGTNSVTTLGDFTWTNTKSSGGDINVSKTEWDDLKVYVNNVRVSKGLSSFSFTPTTAGVSPISAATYNEMRTKINDMSPPTALPAAVTANVTTIAASHFNGLRDSLNSIT